MIVQPARFVAAAALGAVSTALLISVTTDVIPNDLLGRMTPVRSDDVPVLVVIWFAPAQPWLAALSIALLVAALAWRAHVLANAGLRLGPARA
jgi:hypothetical protein